MRRFWEGEDDEIGQLVHRPGGPEHARWVFDYNPKRADDDESGYRFGTHAFKQGEYVTIRNVDGEDAHVPGGLGAGRDLTLAPRCLS